MKAAGTRLLARELRLQSGAVLGPVALAYETYGALSEKRDNAILICHALSGDAHVAAHAGAADDPPGWWEAAVGSGKAFDTDRYFVVCSNVVGSCYGSTGPASIDPRTGRPYGLSFPIVTVADMVEAQRLLLDALGIDRLLAVAGGSLGGMQALQWSVAYPKRIRSAIVLAATASSSAQSIALNELARQAIYADANWDRGSYYGRIPPQTGLALARMVGHVTYLSEASMKAKFGRRLRHREDYGFGFAPEFQIETYLQHQGHRFTERFDANALLYLTKAIDYFDLAYGRTSLAEAFRGVAARFLVVSFSSDWLYPPAQSKELVRALLQNDVDATYVEVRSDYGHDAFLLEIERLTGLTRDFLAQTSENRIQERRHRLPAFAQGAGI